MKGRDFVCSRTLVWPDFSKVPRHELLARFISALLNTRADVPSVPYPLDLRPCLENANLFHHMSCGTEEAELLTMQG